MNWISNILTTDRDRHFVSAMNEFFYIYTFRQVLQIFDLPLNFFFYSLSLFYSFQCNKNNGNFKEIVDCVVFSNDVNLFQFTLWYLLSYLCCFFFVFDLLTCCNKNQYEGEKKRKPRSNKWKTSFKNHVIYKRDKGAFNKVFFSL